MKKFLGHIARSLPYIGKMKKDLDKYANVQYHPGHYYSPVVSKNEIQEHEKSIFSPDNPIKEIDLREKEQMALLNQLVLNYSSIPFSDEKTDAFRYYFKNGLYSYSDGIFLNLIIRHYQPNRIIEIGSGFSSAAMLDTNDHFFDGKINLSFIEPYPERLNSLLKEQDKKTTNIYVHKLQDIETDLFKELQANDILFVDSTHVSKTGSDVNKIIFEILPLLNKGVLIHFHDIFYPFEYPKDWVLGWAGFGWNEIYILRAFLMNNKEYEIVLFNTYLEQVHEDWFNKNMPLCLKNKGGSLWLRKVK